MGKWDRKCCSLKNLARVFFKTSQKKTYVDGIAKGVEQDQDMKMGNWMFLFC